MHGNGPLGTTFGLNVGLSVKFGWSPRARLTVLPRLRRIFALCALIRGSCLTGRRTLVSASAALVMSLLLADASAQQGWLVDPNSGCRVWNPTHLPDETVIWQGPCRDGYAEGHGELRWLSGDGELGHYHGELVGGKMDGMGTVTLADGRTYIGEMKDNMANGHGVLMVQGGLALEGVWKNGCLNAKGYSAFVGWGTSACTNTKSDTEADHAK